jgi:hypothetical protein
MVLIRTLVVLCLLVTQSVAGDQFCSWEIRVMNGKTHELKIFKPDSSGFDISLDGLKGFETCKVMPVRNFEHEGQPTSRLEIYCYTHSGEVMMAQSIASPKFGLDFTRFQLLARPVSISTKGGEVKIGCDDYREFMMYCKP